MIIEMSDGSQVIHHGANIIRLLLRGTSEPGRSEQHRPLAAVGQMFAIVDKLWRMAYAIRAHRAGKEFLNEEDGYLAGGYDLKKKIEQLAAISEDEWRALLDVPSEEVIREQLDAADASPTQIAERLDYAARLPGMISTLMRHSARTRRNATSRTSCLRACLAMSPSSEAGLALMNSSESWCRGRCRSRRR